MPADYSPVKTLWWLPSSLSIKPQPSPWSAQPCFVDISPTSPSCLPSIHASCCYNCISIFLWGLTPWFSLQVILAGWLYFPPCIRGSVCNTNMDNQHILFLCHRDWSRDEYNWVDPIRPLLEHWELLAVKMMYVCLSYRNSSIGKGFLS